VPLTAGRRRRGSIVDQSTHWMAIFSHRSRWGLCADVGTRVGSGNATNWDQRGGT